MGTPERLEVVDGHAVFAATGSEEADPVSEAEVGHDVSRGDLAMLASDPLGRFVDAALGLVVEHEVVPPVGMSGAVAEGVVDGVAERDRDEGEVGHPRGGDAAVPSVEA